MSVVQRLEERTKRSRRMTVKRRVSRARNIRVLLITPQLSPLFLPLHLLPLIRKGQERRRTKQGRQEDRQSRREEDTPHSSSQRSGVLQEAAIVCKHRT